jgi:hypothetical protein
MRRSPEDGRTPLSPIRALGDMRQAAAFSTWLALQLV